LPPAGPKVSSPQAVPETFGPAGGGDPSGARRPAPNKNREVILGPPQAASLAVLACGRDEFDERDKISGFVAAAHFVQVQSSEYFGTMRQALQKDPGERERVCGAPLMDRPDALIAKLPSWLHWHEDGEIRFSGHRLGLYHFIYYYNQGYTAEMLLCQFPTLELSSIHKTIAFYLDTRAEVDSYIGRYETEIEQLRAAGRHAPGIAEIRKRLEARQRAGTVEAKQV
jgi:uncharacterized protein (DUF433 family)